MERRLSPTGRANRPRLTRNKGSQQPRIIGVAAVYYNGHDDTQYELWRDGPVERIMPGAFRDALAGKNDVRALFNHDPNHVLGRLKARTLKLDDSPTGLRYEIDADTTDGRRVAELLRRGDISGSSFGFVVRDEHWRSEGGREIREIRGVELIDVSPVTFPAYTATSAGVRETDPARRLRQLRLQELAEIERETLPTARR